MKLVFCGTYNTSQGMVYFRFSEPIGGGGGGGDSPFSALSKISKALMPNHFF